MFVWLSCIVGLLTPSLIYANQPLSIDVPIKGTSFIIPLQANATTGYQWSVVNYDKKVFHLTSSGYKRPGTEVIGAGGVMLFNFTLNTNQSYPKRSDFIFQYGRSWEPSTKAIPQKVTVRFIK